MLEFTFSDALTARLEAGVKASVDFTPVMAVIADKMRTNSVLNFETETGPDGVRWKASRRATDDGGLTLTASGKLHQSITAASTDRTAIAGTDRIYAAIHQFGGRIAAKPGKALKTPFGPRGSVTMPARPFLGFSAEDLTDIEQLLGDHLTAALAA
jgi:phage virion morphogenesis protein